MKTRHRNAGSLTCMRCALWELGHSILHQTAPLIILFSILSYLLLHHCLLLFPNPFFCGPTLPYFPQTSFVSQPFCNGRLFIHGTAAQRGQLDELPAEETSHTASHCPWIQWGFRLEIWILFFPHTEEQMGGREKGEDLVYLVIGTGVELKAWTLISVVPESKGGSEPR